MVQVVILAEDTEIREKIAQHDIHVQTIAEVAPIEVQPAKVLSHLYTYLGLSQQNRELLRNILLVQLSIIKILHVLYLVFRTQQEIRTVWS